MNQSLTEVGRVVIPLDDSSRIQWLENNLPRLGAVGRAPSGTWQIFTEDGTLSVGESLREAIDTAMQSNRVVRKSGSPKGWLKLLGPLFIKNSSHLDQDNNVSF